MAKLVLLLLLVLVIACMAHESDHGKHKELKTDLLKPKIATYGHHCKYDELVKRNPIVKRLVDQEEDMQTWRRDSAGVHAKRDPNWRPFRVAIVADNLQDDPYSCYSQGAQVQYYNDMGVLDYYTCSPNDILISDKLNYLNNSMLAVAAARFLDLLRVDRYYPRLNVSNSQDSGCDRYIGPLSLTTGVIVTNFYSSDKALLSIS